MFAYNAGTSAGNVRNHDGKTFLVIFIKTAGILNPARNRQPETLKILSAALHSFFGNITGEHFPAAKGRDDALTAWRGADIQHFHIFPNLSKPDGNMSGAVLHEKEAFPIPRKQGNIRTGNMKRLLLFIRCQNNGFRFLQKTKQLRIAAF